jgi:hypothetical protein
MTLKRDEIEVMSAGVNRTAVTDRVSPTTQIIIMIDAVVSANKETVFVLQHRAVSPLVCSTLQSSVSLDFEKAGFRTPATGS